MDNKGWFGLTDVQGFFANQNVNVVSPIGGQYSYYTDWVADDPALGRNKWQTYLTQELPPLINQELNADGRNAVGGLSMSGGSALDLAIQAPGLYRAAGSYSGCPATSDPNQANQIALSLIPSGANAANMWGPLGGPDWVAHDPSKNAAKLRVSGCTRLRRRARWAPSTTCRRTSRRPSAARSWRASPGTAPSSSRMPRPPPVSRSSW
ncbi:MAG: alpha/beta hydrolase family protein [Mycobacterium sp.]